MKPENTSPRKDGGAHRARSSVRIPNIPIEWMDPMSWRLPSGKALAEFALQAGFLAPMMLGTPAFKRKGTKVQTDAPVVTEESMGEAPERPGTFRQTR
jgi:hypothetical protein